MGPWSAQGSTPPSAAQTVEDPGKERRASAPAGELSCSLNLASPEEKKTPTILCVFFHYGVGYIILNI